MGLLAGAKQNGSNGKRINNSATSNSGAFQRIFLKLWERKYHRAYPFQPKDGATLKKLCAVFKNEAAEFKAVVLRYLDADERFFAGHPASKLLADIPRFATEGDDGGLDGAPRGDSRTGDGDDDGDGSPPAPNVRQATADELAEFDRQKVADLVAAGRSLIRKGKLKEEEFDRWLEMNKRAEGLAGVA